MSLGHRPRRLAVGQLPPRLPAPRLQPGRGRPAGVRRRLADHRRPARRAEFRASRMPDGVLEAVRARQRRPAMVGCRGRTRCAGCRRAGILDRCTATNTCPKIIEHFGAAEVWGLKLTPGMGGHRRRRATFRCPTNVRRYYIPSTQHGGGSGGFNVNPAAAAECVPSTELRHRHIRRQSGAAHRDGQCDPRPFPQLGHEGHASAAEPLPDARRHGKTLVDADARRPWGSRPSRACRRGADRLDQSRCSTTTSGPTSTTRDASGVPTIVPPTIKHVIRMKVPERGCRRQRARRRAGGAARRAARHLSRMEHHGRRDSTRARSATTPAA